MANLDSNNIFYKKNVISRRGGFTLLELIFVAAILIFISVLAVPRFRGSFNFLVARNFAFDIVSFARYAQAAAVTKATVNRMTLDSEKKVLMIESYAGTEYVNEELVEIWYLEKSKLMPGSVSVDLKDGKGRIKFYPDGTADEAVINIATSAGKSYTISIEGVTGYVRLEEDKDE